MNNDDSLGKFKEDKLEDEIPSPTESVDDIKVDHEKAGWYRIVCSFIVVALTIIKGTRCFDFKMGELTFAYSLGIFYLMACRPNVIKIILDIFGLKRK